MHCLEWKYLSLPPSHHSLYFKQLHELSRSLAFYFDTISLSVKDNTTKQVVG